MMLAKIKHYVGKVFFTIIAFLFCNYAMGCMLLPTTLPYLKITIPSTINIPAGTPLNQPFSDWFETTHETVFVYCFRSNIVKLGQVGQNVGSYGQYGIFATGVTGIGFIIEARGSKDSASPPQTWHPVGTRGEVTVNSTSAAGMELYTIALSARIKLVKTTNTPGSGSLDGNQVGVFMAPGANMPIVISGGISPPPPKESSCEDFTTRLNRATPLRLKKTIPPGSILPDSVLISGGALTCTTNQNLTIKMATQSLINTNKPITIDGLTQTIYQIPGVSNIGITIAIQWNNQAYIDLNNHRSFTITAPSSSTTTLSTAVRFKIHYVSLAALLPNSYQIPETTLAQITYESAEKPTATKVGEVILNLETITIQQPACMVTIDGSNAVRDLTLPSIFIDSLSSIKIGEIVPAPYHASFNLAFLCPDRGIDPSLAALNLKYSFTDPKRVGSTSDYIPNMLKTADAAKGVGFQLFQNDKKVHLGTDYVNSQMVVNPTSSGLRYIPMRAHYIRLPSTFSGGLYDTITAGKVKGLLTIHFNNP